MGQHVVSGSLLQLPNESSVGAGAFKYKAKNLLSDTPNN
jgi:hypothetical protein